MASPAELGFRTELIFHRADGEVIDRRAEHGCRVIRTPSNPTFYWGNYLLFDRAPHTGDAERWSRLFEQLITRDQPLCTHRTFGWIEDEAGEVDAFQASGYRLDNAAVMQSTDVPAVPAPTTEATLRPLAQDGAAAEHEWLELVELGVATRSPEYGEDGYRIFERRSVERWRALAASGRGNWFGAFIEIAGCAPRLVAALGIYAEAEPEDGVRLARYQSVRTDSSYRRRGLCRALVATAARYARDELRADRLIIVAAAGEMPERLYASVGFTAAGLQRGVQRNGDADAAGR